MAKIKIEVAYASPHKQKILKLEVSHGTTVQDAIAQSGILTLFPEINLTQQKVGIFSKQIQLNDIVTSGDRIEIYRPLIIDPKDARRAKAKAQKTK